MANDCIVLELLAPPLLIVKWQLFLPHAKVPASLLPQAEMGPLFHYQSLLQNSNMVSLDNSTQSVRYNENGFSLAFQSLDGLLYKLLRLVIERRGGFIEEHYFRSVMANWGANHGAISYGHIGADLISLASMLRIPVCMHNVEESKIFRPASWNAFGMDKEGSDYRACDTYGPIYGKTK
jgi:hypothetical protein